MKIKIEAIIEVHESFNDFDEEEMEWFVSMLDDKKYTFLILHSNDFGDEIGHTHDFKYEIIKT